MGPLIDAPTLAVTLAGTPGAVVLDATWRLPAEAADARGGHAAARIPGARFMDLDAFAAPDAALPLTAPDAARFAEQAGALGLTTATPLVIYDQHGVYAAGRAWWLFRLFGHAAQVAVLDGGLPAWRAAGLPIESGPPHPPAGTVYLARPQPGLIADLARVRRAVSGDGTLILDARPAARFAGAAPEPFPDLRGGHMPGARNLFYRDLLAPDETFLPPPALRARLAAAGLDGAQPVITTCGAGVTACLLALAIAQAGLPDAAIYDGSWSEWGGRTDTPVSTTPREDTT